MAWQVRLESRAADQHCLVVPTLAEVFHWYEPLVPRRSTCATCQSGAVGYRYDRWRQGPVLIHRYLRSNNHENPLADLATGRMLASGCGVELVAGVLGQQHHPDLIHMGWEGSQQRQQHGGR